MNRLLVLALALAASNSFAAMPSAVDQLSDIEEFIPACYPQGVPLEPQCSLGGDVLN